MRKLTKVLAVVMVISLFGAGAWAYDVVEHVTVAGDGRGDVLIYPIYVAFPGWNTNISVVNTDRQNSVVAKVVFRSQSFTEELRDFLIFLSPNDVWDATIRVNDATGRIELFSDDDSVRTAAGVFASKTNPFIIELVTPACTNDTANVGYIEIFESWAGNMATLTGAGWPGQCILPPVLNNLGTVGIAGGNSPVAKRQIECYYNNSVLARIPFAIGTPLAASFWPDETINSLTGALEISAPSAGISAVIPATALKDYNNGDPLTHAFATTFNQHDRMFNKLNEVDAALAVTEMYMQYEPDLSVHVITFPTKQSHPHGTLNPATGVCRFRAPAAGTAFPVGFQSAFWQQNGARIGVNNNAADPLFNTSAEYSIHTRFDVFDMLENRIVPAGGIVSPAPVETWPHLRDEVNMLVLSGRKLSYYTRSWDIFDKGWIRYIFRNRGDTANAATANAPVRPNVDTVVANGNELNFTGAPAIGAVFTIKGSDAYMQQAPANYGIVQYRENPAGAGPWAGLWTNAAPGGAIRFTGYPAGVRYEWWNPVQGYHVSE